MDQNFSSCWKKMGDKRRFCINHRVRYSDTDRMDMVYHGSYIPMLEAARVDTLREIGWVYSEMESNDILLPVIDLKLKYKMPARYDQVLRIETHVVRPPSAKLEFCFHVYHEQNLLVEANVVLAFVNAVSGLPQRAPSGLEKALSENGLIHS
ncbi:MAG: thioesterase family protein [Flavobacteriales bacterium]|nr:thioesterase family protein [Flavobacteriales bacterium]